MAQRRMDTLEQRADGSVQCGYHSLHWTLFSIGLDNDLAPNRRQAIIWTNADPIYWHMYATPAGYVIGIISHFTGRNKENTNDICIYW